MINNQNNNFYSCTKVFENNVLSTGTAIAHNFLKRLQLLSMLKNYVQL